MSTVEVLAAAREKLCQGWTQDTPARNSIGEPVNANSEEAVCWCLYGALSVASSSDQAFCCASESLERALDYDTQHGHRFVSFFNDDPDTTLAKVMTLIDKAIAMESCK
jgi:hypothetical protein